MKNNPRHRQTSFLLTIMLLSACASAPPQAPERWRWIVAETGFAASTVEVLRSGALLTTIDVACDLSDAKARRSDTEEHTSSRVEAIYGTPYPNGLLIISCPTGAHSERIDVYDPAGRGATPVYSRVGSYFVDWRIDHGVLLVSYDLPCDAEDRATASCGMAFHAVEEQVEL